MTLTELNEGGLRTLPKSTKLIPLQVFFTTLVVETMSALRVMKVSAEYLPIEDGER